MPFSKRKLLIEPARWAGRYDKSVDWGYLKPDPATERASGVGGCVTGSRGYAARPLRSLPRTVHARAPNPGQFDSTSKRRDASLVESYCWCQRPSFRRREGLRKSFCWGEPRVVGPTPPHMPCRVATPSPQQATQWLPCLRGRDHSGSESTRGRPP